MRRFISTARIGASPSPATFTMAVHTVPSSASLLPNSFFHSGYGNGIVALGLLLLPFSRSLLRKVPGMQLLTVCASCAAIVGLSGCGSGSGFFGQHPKRYTINVLGTIAGAGGATLQHSVTVTLTVE